MEPHRAGPGWGPHQGAVFAPAQRASPRAGLLVREYESPWQDLLPWAGVFRGEATWVPAQVSHQGEWVSAQKVVPGTRVWLCPRAVGSPVTSVSFLAVSITGTSYSEDIKT